MAIKRVKTDGYGQVELNRCAFLRDGKIEAQCKLVGGKAENGMVLNMNKQEGTCAPLKKDLTPIFAGLCYSAEHTQDATQTGLKDFVNEEGSYPRIGRIEMGDLFTTNTIAYFDNEFTSDENLFAENVKSLNLCILDGVFTFYKNTATITSANVIPLRYKVTKWTVLSDGQRAAQIMVL
nr:MAG TPA: hypothetical protein [Caudoviricetes sp.]